MGGAAKGSASIASASQAQQRDLTKDEKAVVQETMEENRRKGFWKRIFPSVDYLYYKQFFEEDRPYNRLLDERLMARKREGTHHARMMNEKMPIFLQAAGYNMSSARSGVKAGAAPPSGSDPKIALAKS